MHLQQRSRRAARAGPCVKCFASVECLGVRYPFWELSFLSYAPPSIDGDVLWNSLVSPSKRLNSLIDTSIDEMSTMAGGAVAGYAAPMGGTVNIRKRSKREKPKVRRAKRQRRR